MINSSLKKANEVFETPFVTKPQTKKSNYQKNKGTKVKHFSGHSEISSDANFLKSLRLQLDLNRTEASKVLGMSISSFI